MGHYYGIGDTAGVLVGIEHIPDKRRVEKQGNSSVRSNGELAGFGSANRQPTGYLCNKGTYRASDRADVGG